MLTIDPAATAIAAIDTQKGFMPGTEPGYGELPAPHGDDVARPLADLAALAALFVTTGDEHTPDHSSFTAQGGIWPVHCVAGTPGAEMHPLIAAVATPGWHFAKGVTRDSDQYSAFENTDIADRLHAAGIKTLIVGGLVTNVCVRKSALDALAAGFTVIIVMDACRAITAPGLPTADETFAELAAAGATLTTSSELLETLAAAA